MHSEAVNCSEGSLHPGCILAAGLRGAGEYDPIAIHGNSGAPYPFNHKFIVQ
jgi:hypothetical protein